MTNIAHNLENVKAYVPPIRPTDITARQLSWLAERIEKGKSGPFVEIVAITPEIAKRLLELNDGNRPINERLIAEISADIENNRWELNGETIVVSSVGLLNDGQHRLEAVLRTQKTIQSAIMFGVVRESRMTVDMGRQRTAANFLAMSGATHATHSASITKLLILFESNIYDAGRGGVNNPTKQAIRLYYKNHRKEIIAAIDALKGEKFTRNVGMTPLAVAHIITNRANKEDAAVFFSRALTGVSIKQNDPILFLRQRFMEKNVGLRTHERLETLLRYWNAWKSGRKISKAIPREGAYPKVID
jgi:hypothetical protein